jgi:hypothetical protein
MASKVEMTYPQALAAFNAVMAADPRIQALGKRPWGDVVYEDELEASRRPPVCPWAPKKEAAPARPLVAVAPMASGPRCMVSGCSYRGLNLDEDDICASCHKTSNGTFQMRPPSEMTLAELEKAHNKIDEERKHARRNGDRWAMNNLDVGAAAIQTAKDALNA